MKKALLRPFVLPALMLLCTLFYYWGELVDWAAWDALRREFFYGIHDVHRMLFLIPIVYAGYTARIKGAIIVTLVSFLIFLPRAFFISPFPDPLLRMILFIIFAGTLGCLTGVVHNGLERCQQLEVAVATEKEKLLKIVDGMADGIIITDPEYRIRFMNAKMVAALGEAGGLPCYQHLRKLDAPCQHDCHLSDVIKHRRVEKWQCTFPIGSTYEVVSAPYVDYDGTACQLSIFREVTRRGKN